MSGVTGDSNVLYGQPDHFSKEMKELINSPNYSDVKFYVGEDRTLFTGHKCLLSTRCEVFKAVFDAPVGDPEAPLILADIRPKIFHTVLEYIYTNSATITTDGVCDLLAAAVEFSLDGLKKLCNQFMRDYCDKDLVCEFLQAGICHSQDHIVTHCIQFIEEYTEDVFSSVKFKEISEHALRCVLQSDRLRIDEAKLIGYVKEWAHINAVVTGESMETVATNVIQFIRLPILDGETLSRIEYENESLHYIPLSMIAYAWKCHALKLSNPKDPLLRHRNPPDN
ncbi:BTB/POZ domain-containing protein 19-like [Oopsacas minuta]|uniref:BTB/POZ domain-containing protein 19-like n=1 Tax=Oopsacas minuta TaxID=111878 RepID=A0AAV7JLY8_9METZ|nr:BTB/POZ domain-containing protein 19-like [Oopsacas minuta]